MTQTIIAAIAVIVCVTLILVALLLVVKNWITPKGTVKIDINNGKKELNVAPGNNLMATLAGEKIFLPSACGGKANCGQCKVQVFEGGGEILPTETGFFNRKQIKDGWRLGCQVQVKDTLKIQVAESALSVKKLECEVISNDNVATFIKEFTVKLPEGEHIDFKSGEYIQIDIPEYEADFSDMGVDPIYMGDWEKYGITSLRYKNTEPTIRAYSMASYPGEKNIIKLNVRIATPRSTRPSPRASSSSCRACLRESLPPTYSPANRATKCGSAAPSASSSCRRTILKTWNTSSWAAAPAWLLCAAISCSCSRL